MCHVEGQTVYGHSFAWSGQFIRPHRKQLTVCKGSCSIAVACSCLSAVVHGNPEGTVDQCMQAVTCMCHVPKIMMHMMKHDMTSHILLFIAAPTCKRICTHAFLPSSTCWHTAVDNLERLAWTHAFLLSSICWHRAVDNVFETLAESMA